MATELEQASVRRSLLKNIKEAVEQLTFCNYAHSPVVLEGINRFLNVARLGGTIECHLLTEVDLDELLETVNAIRKSAEGNAKNEIFVCLKDFLIERNKLGKNIFEPHTAPDFSKIKKRYKLR